MLTARKSTTPRTLNYDDRTGCLVITEQLSRTRTVEDLYWVEEVPVAASYGSGRGFELRKHVQTADTGRYHTFISNSPKHTACDCRGFQRHGRCKHAAALTKLIDLGMIADPRCNGEQDVASTEVEERVPVAAAPVWWGAESTADMQGGF